MKQLEVCDECGAKCLTPWRGGQMTSAGWMDFAFERRDCEGCGKSWYRPKEAAAGKSFLPQPRDAVEWARQEWEAQEDEALRDIYPEGLNDWGFDAGEAGR